MTKIKKPSQWGYLNQKKVRRIAKANMRKMFLLVN